ncbi:hypothetical protein [Roseateles depolymerans]|uniref:Uncharacterized protein n=1 Tax=Roseateles depolymerans TaxID=76731 RepID=A0A0U3MR93_9BURK|nr:hypothetical protein [Roseateles depolymerans]ALV05475.1 hypothetical protein RD2015_980 [Roseateles depolymerans]REG14508.1 hypothetical protein DES44_3004 [Roseateles depolymerans]
MVIALITLALMMIGAVAALRSMNATLSGAGNIGMKRDMSNQVEVALRKAMASLTGATSATLSNSSTAMNYSATILPTTPEGIPTVLLGTSPTTVGGLGVATNVVDLTTAPAAGTGSPPQVTMYYVIDRLCKNAGVVDTTNCLTPTTVSTGTDSKGGVPPPTKPVYRVSVRVDGPRGSQSFYQATLTN